MVLKRKIQHPKVLLLLKVISTFKSKPSGAFFKQKNSAGDMLWVVSCFTSHKNDNSVPGSQHSTACGTKPKAQRVPDVLPGSL